MKASSASSARASHPLEGFGALGGATLPARAAPYAALWLALRRARSGWRFLAAVAFDLLLVVTLFCGISIYTALLTAIELRSQLAAASVGGRNVDVTIIHTRLSAALERKEDQAVMSLARSTLATFAPGEPARFTVVQPLLLTSLGAAPPDNYTQLQLEAYQQSQLAPHIRLLAGNFLQATKDPSAAPDALITQQMAQVDGARIGDTLTVRGGSFFDAQNLTIRVSGIWIPRDPADPFWNDRGFLTNPQHDTDPYVFPTLLAPDSLASLLAPSQLIVTQHWTFYTQTRLITPARMQAVTTSLTTFRSGLATALSRKNYVVGVLTITDLDKLLASVMAQRLQFALSIDSVGALTLGAALLTLALVAHLFVDRDRLALVTIRSRGASAAQVLGAYMALMACAGTLAAIAGAALAVWLTPALILRYVAPSSGTSESASAVTWAYLAGQIEPGLVALPALACLLICVAVAGWAAYGALDGNTRAQALAEAAELPRPWWQRLNLDIFLAVLCTAAYLDLAFYGGASGVVAAHGAPSPLLVAAPLLLLLAGILLLLRLFPFVARLWSRAASHGPGATALLASMRLTRGQSRAALQPLLVMLAVGVLTLAVTYEANLQQSASRLAAYQVGADLRLVERTTETPAADALIRARLARLPGAPVVTSTYRGVTHTAAFWNVVGGPQDAVAMLAIDPRSWASVSAPVAWRPSYASAPLAMLMSQMAAHEAASAAGVAPAGSASNPVWAIVSHDFAQAQGRKVGDVFRLLLPDNTTQYSYFVVGAIVNDFPTLDPGHTSSAFVIAGERSFFAAMAAQNEGRNVAPGPNEYWLRVRCDAGAVQAVIQRQSDALDLDTLLARQSLEASVLGAASLVGVRALLLFGAVAIGALALLAAALQTSLDIRERLPELMTMRALGVSRAQLAASMIAERLFTALFGALGGALTGWALTVTALPYLPAPETQSGAISLLVPTNPWLLALAVGALVGALVAQSVVVSVRAAGVAINLRALDV